jgi:hypothetical protein
MTAVGRLPPDVDRTDDHRRVATQSGSTTLLEAAVRK